MTGQTSRRHPVRPTSFPTGYKTGYKPSGYNRQRKKPSVTHCYERLYLVEPTGIEPATSWLQTRESPVTSADSKALTPTPSAACTSACTSEGENANADALDTALLDTSPQAADADADRGDEGEGIDQGGTAGGSSTAEQGDPLAALAAAVANLSPANRERLAAMLTGQQGEGERGNA